MRNGIYKASFAVGPNAGEGIVVMRDGYLGGGDYGFTYEGQYQDNGGTVEGTLSVVQWDATVPNVFAGLTSFELQFSGQADGQGFRLAGKTPAAPGQTVHVVLHRLR